ncbi:MAG: hypothetical protein GWN31_08095 [Candidatus Thorarchaeota archaeon]|nr:hypothetical protein [Candidatus Thorarchaeota archaeon]NIW51986.1 hypothetical protein [Candidatus Korarchaeota archaeon]
MSEKQGHSLTYLEEGNKERSKKEGIYKKAEQSLDFENSVETPLEVQDFLASWRAYIFSHSADFKVNANAVWGNGIRHAEAIAKLLASGEKLIDIDMVFNYWKSGKTWFESCLTPADLIREKNGQSVYTRLFFGAKRALSKNAQYQLRSGIMNVIEAEKNGTLHDAPF